MNHSAHTEQNKKALRDALINNCHGSADNMTISALCQLAGVSRASFYNYYAGIHSIIEDIEAECWQSFRTEDYPRDRSRAYVTTRHFANNKATWLFLMHNGGTRDAIKDDTRKVLHDNLLARNCKLPPEMLEIFTLAIVPSMIEIIIHYLSCDSSMTPDDFAALFDMMEYSTYDMVQKYMARKK